MIRPFIRRYGLRKLLIFIGDIVVLSGAILLALSVERVQSDLVFVNPFSSLQLIILYSVVGLVTLVSFRYMNLYKENNYLASGKQILLIVKSLFFSGILLIIFTFFVKKVELYDNSRLHLILFLINSIIFVASDKKCKRQQIIKISQFFYNYLSCICLLLIFITNFISNCVQPTVESHLRVFVISS